MDQPFTPELCQIADSAGIALYQTFTPQEASLFLRLKISEVEKLQRKGLISYIQLSTDTTGFFGIQLVNYLLNNIKGQNPSVPPPEPGQERILRIEEVVKLTGISRTTIWRKERRNDFPARVPLSSVTVGWRASEVAEWIRTR